jgi:Na+-driven multidrug efflux pump
MDGTMANEAPAIRPAAFDRQTRMLLDGPILPTLLRLAAPNATVMFAQMSIGWVEVYFVAHLGTNALAGISLVFPILSLVGALSQGAVGGGVVTAIARALGRGERTEASDLVWYALAIAGGCGAMTTLVVLGRGRRSTERWAREESPLPPR